MECEIDETFEALLTEMILERLKNKNIESASYNTLEECVWIDHLHREKLAVLEGVEAILREDVVEIFKHCRA